MSTDSSKEYLISCKEKFDSFFKAVAIYVSRFQQVTLDCCKRIEKCSGNISFITHYVIDWFKLYLGVKDELGVIITGEIVREYHKNLHRLYIHDRGHENTYFNGPLSACSKDGMQYEWRLLTDKYGNKKVRHL